MISTIYYDYNNSTFVHDRCLKKQKLHFNPSLRHMFNGAMRLRVGRMFRTLLLGGIKLVFRDKNVVFARYRICVVSIHNLDRYKSARIEVICN